MTFFRLPVAIAAAGLLGVWQVAAAEPEELIVTGSRIGGLGQTRFLGLHQDASQISLRNSDGILSSLSLMPGVQISQPGGAAGRPFLSVRGGEPNFTLVLVDGIKVKDRKSVV